MASSASRPVSGCHSDFTMRVTPGSCSWAFACVCVAPAPLHFWVRLRFLPPGSSLRLHRTQGRGSEGPSPAGICSSNCRGWAWAPPVSPQPGHLPGEAWPQGGTSQQHRPERVLTGSPSSRVPRGGRRGSPTPQVSLLVPSSLHPLLCGQSREGRRQSRPGPGEQAWRGPWAAASGGTKATHASSAQAAQVQRPRSLPRGGGRLGVRTRRSFGTERGFSFEP